MANENETVAEICHEMYLHEINGQWVNGYEVGRLADRIDAACKREIARIAAPTPEQWTEIARQGSELADLKRENERQHEALTPVLECDESSMVSFKDAVHAAKRIAQKDLPCQRAEPCPCIPDGICEGCEKEKCIKGGK